MKADIEIIEAVKSGHRAAFSELVIRYQRPLLRLVMRFSKDQSVAEDIVQDSFIKAYKKLHTFEGRSSFKSWLFQIGVNTAKNKLRDKSSDFMNIEDVHLGVAGNLDSNLMHQDLSEMIRSEVDRLPDKQRTALKLRIFEDLSFKEIAKIMDCPYDTAKANYRHALMKLKERVERNKQLKTWSEKEMSHFFEVRGRLVEVEQ